MQVRNRELETETESPGPGRNWLITVPEARRQQVRQLASYLVHQPFTRRTWSELLYFCISAVVAVVGFAFVAAAMALGLVLLLTFLGVVVIAAALRGARGLGALERRLARRLLADDIPEAEPFAARPGLLGWLQSALRDRSAWRSLAYLLLKVPLVIFGVWFALSVWIDAFFCLSYPLWGRGSVQPTEFGVIKNLFQPGYLSVGTSGFLHGLFIVCTGLLLLVLAPWPTRAVLWVDRWLLRSLVGPDATTTRMRSLERTRTQAVDASAATLRRIERDLHDGTQAQLVAVAMRLGQAKEKMASGDAGDLEAARQLVEEAHKGAKEAIVELRDLARGIHPPALDTGLEGALSTLAARSTIPTTLSVMMHDRPTPAIEAITYFCVAELLANAAQHAQASHATVSCVEHGGWVRVVVRDDGQGGASPSSVGSSSSGLAGLADRVQAVDGHLDITSPIGGPTIVTVDLPMHA